MFSRILDSVPISGSIKSWSFHDDSFPPAKKDLVFAYQTGQPDVKKVMAHMLVLAGICGMRLLALTLYSLFTMSWNDAPVHCMAVVIVSG